MDSSDLDSLKGGRMKFHTCACDCGSSTKAVRLFETRDHNFQSTKESAWVMRCPSCGSLFPAVFPSDDTLGQAYSAYYTVPKKRQGMRKVLRALIDSTRAGHIVRNTPKTAKTVLDYGCGSGEYLNLLAEQGYQAQLFGTDITQPQAGGAEVFKWLSLEEYDHNGLQYDWITLSHVVEHLPVATQVLSRLRACCISHGCVWLSTPNADSVLISCFGGHARDVDFPRHRQIYSRNALAQILSACGFDSTFLPSPRIDTLMNFASCVRNLMRDRSVPIMQKVAVLLTSLARTGVHLMKPKAWRAADAPEIVLIGRPSKGPVR